MPRRCRPRKRRADLMAESRSWPAPATPLPCCGRWRRATRHCRPTGLRRLLEAFAVLGLVDRRRAWRRSSRRRIFQHTLAREVASVLSAILPYMVGRIASGRSLSMISAMVCHSIGSMWVASAISGSVMILGRIGVHQNDAVALLPARLARRLRAGVVDTRSPWPMMIGPAPMIRMLWMSVRLGITAVTSSKVSSSKS